MATSLPVYSSRQVQISFLGETVSGTAETFANIQRNSDFTTEKVGGDGSVGISISPDRTGMFELTVDQGSTANTFLSGVIELQETAGTFHTGSITLVDPSGAAIVKLSDCHIKSGPTVVLGSERQDNTWTIFCSDYTYLSVPEGFADTAGVLVDVAASLENLDTFLR